MNCQNCNHTDFKLLTNQVRFDNQADVLQCKNCGLIFLDQNSFEFPEDFYEKEYHQTYLTHVEPDALNPEKYYQKMLKTTKKWADKVNQLLTGNEVVLDLGCSTGHLMTQIQDNAKEVYGHDLSEKEIQYAKEKLGLNVDSIPLDQRFEENTFDYITMIFVFEHIAEPVEFLNYIKKFLKPDGKLLILVPNIQDALVSFYDIPAFRDFYYCIEHLFYYTPQTLEQMCKKAGFGGTFEPIQEYPITNHLNWAYRQRPSDVLASRRFVPDVALQNPDIEANWESFWQNVNIQYQQFLKENGHADRIWAVIEKN